MVAVHPLCLAMFTPSSHPLFLHSHPSSCSIPGAPRLASRFCFGYCPSFQHKVSFAQVTSCSNGSALRGLFKANCAVLTEKRLGAAAVQGSERQIMEDTYCIIADPKGAEPSFFGVFDGHGGIAVAEMLKTSFWTVYKTYLSESDLKKSTVAAYLEFDKMTLAQPKGFFGALRERGAGGSRCGATAATAVLIPSQGENQLLVAANVGDARVLLSRGGHAIQLSIDHKPEVEAERRRIEAKNPTPKKPLVVNVGGVWRVGGLLSLSRAFGDAYLKDWSDGKADGARGGFGLTAEPDVFVETLGPEDDAIVLGTDGLWEKITNQEAVDICISERASSSEGIAKHLIKLAQDRGATDDIAAIVILLSQEEQS